MSKKRKRKKRGNRWDDFDVMELRQLHTGDIGPELEDEILRAFEARIETLAGREMRIELFGRCEPDEP